MKQERKLAAIMFTDIEGFSKMMQHDEDKALVVKNAHREVLQQGHELYNGRITQHYGDGTLSIFQSAVEAVQCAVYMQSAFLSQHKIPVRMGLHLGDIVCDDDNIYGDGVNLASRIESLGVAGCVLISDKVEAEIHNHPELQTMSMGSFLFKNINHEIEVFAIKQPGLVIPAAHTLNGKTVDHRKNSKKPLGLDALMSNPICPNIRSIAVLPFVNLSRDLEQEHFGDCLAEEVLIALGGIKGLKVAARTSSFQYRGTERDLNLIRNTLGVTAVIDGCVRRYNGKFRITVQLVGISDGFLIWSERYDNDTEDVFLIQEEIARMVTRKLETLISIEEEHVPVGWGLRNSNDGNKSSTPAAKGWAMRA